MNFRAGSLLLPSIPLVVEEEEGVGGTVATEASKGGPTTNTFPNGLEMSRFGGNLLIICDEPEAFEKEEEKPPPNNEDVEDEECEDELGRSMLEKSD